MTCHENKNREIFFWRVDLRKLMLVKISCYTVELNGWGIDNLMGRAFMTSCVGIYGLMGGVFMA